MDERTQTLLLLIGLGIGGVIIYSLTKPKLPAYITVQNPYGGYTQVPIYYPDYPGQPPVGVIEITNPFTNEKIKLYAYSVEQYLKLKQYEIKLSALGWLVRRIEQILQR